MCCSIKKNSSVASPEPLFTLHSILQPTRAYLDSKVNTLNGFFFFFHPERIRQHAMQTLNSSVRTSPLTVNFILSAFTWPTEQPSPFVSMTHGHIWEVCGYSTHTHMKKRHFKIQLQYAHTVYRSLMSTAHLASHPSVFRGGSDM